MTSIYDIPKDVIGYLMFRFMLYEQIKQCYRSSKLFRVLKPKQLALVKKSAYCTLVYAAEDGDTELFQYIATLHQLYNRPAYCFYGYSVVKACIERYKHDNDNHHTILWTLLTQFKRLQFKYDDFRNIFNSYRAPENIGLYLQFIRWCIDNGFDFHKPLTKTSHQGYLRYQTSVTTYTLSEFIVQTILQWDCVDILKALHNTFGTFLFPVTQQHTEFVMFNSHKLHPTLVVYSRSPS